MKRLKFHRAIVAIAMMIIGWLPSLAHDFEVDGIYYNKTSDNTVEVTYQGENYYSYEEYVGDIVIPSSVNNNGISYSITSIGDEAFSGCWMLADVVIGKSVTSIGGGAFSFCSGLTSIVIPNSITSIGNDAFSFCSGLTSIEIPNNVTSIGNRVFSFCSSLTSIVVDVGNTKYDSRNGCNAIIETASNTLIVGCQNTKIPHSIMNIGDNAFCGSDLISLEIPNSIMNIGDSAFSNCSSLSSIRISNSVTSIGKETFRNCNSLTDVVIGKSVTSIGDWAFDNCSNLTSIEIPNSVTSIGERAFSGCSGLTSIVVDSGNSKYDSRNECNAIIETASNTLITGCKNSKIPNSVTSIGNWAFYGCSDLTSIEIPNSVTSIGGGAFGGCSGLTSIEIPNSVSSIGYGTFIDCTGLTIIDIPNSVAEIGDYAFYGCIGLTIIDIPNSVTSIGYGAFAFCESMTSVVIGNSVTCIGEWAFYECTDLTSVIIGSRVTNIGYGAFASCTNLTEIICYVMTPPEIYFNTFSEYSADLYVPVGCKTAYEAADYWKNFNNIIEVTLDKPITLNDNNVTVASIGDNIVVKNAKLGSVVNVYSSNGALIKSMTAPDGSVVIEAPIKGIYVVVVDNKSFKVMVK